MLLGEEQVMQERQLTRVNKDAAVGKSLIVEQS